MLVMKLLTVPLLSLVLTACAASPRGQQAEDAAGTICEREAHTGSMLSSTRCRTEAQRAAEKRAVDTLGNSVRPSNPAPAGGGRGS